MVEDAPNLVLELLKRIQGKLDAIGLDLLDLKVRASATVQHLAQQAVQLAALNVRLDRFDERLGRIERRLELIEVRIERLGQSPRPTGVPTCPQLSAKSRRSSGPLSTCSSKTSFLPF